MHSLNKKFAMVVHGGAGVIRKSSMSAELREAVALAMKESVQAGLKILESGGTSLNAVEAACIVLEDSPLFNAGKGAVYTSDNKHELDASIMDGNRLKAGAICGTTRIKNPIKCAKAVMHQTEHVLLAGQGADVFAESIGLEMVDNSYFDTDYRLQQIKKLKSEGEKKAVMDHTHFDKINQEAEELLSEKAQKMGTIGAVALDCHGNLAAGTTTGGMTNKKFGRVGDSPIIGAGNYANNETCAISCTGHGEYFMKSLVAYDCHALMKYKQLPLKEACLEALNNVAKLGGDGGLIGVDKMGNITLPFNSEGMYRAWYVEGQDEIKVLMYKEGED